MNAQISDKPNFGGKKTIGCGCIGLLLGFFLIILVAASIYMVNYALKPGKNKGKYDYNGQYTVMEKRYPWIKPWVDSLREAKAIRDTFVMASDGDRHHAVIISAPKGKDNMHATNAVAVLVPGYTDCAIDMLHFGYIYGKLLGMNLVIPDLHANGKSDGKAMQMGWKDREDLLQWIGIADSLYRDATGHARIVVHGVSMGAATAMNVSGDIDKYPFAKDVKCFVEDCGYTSA